MKKSIFSLIVIVLVTVLYLAACQPQAEEGFSAEKAAEMIAGFKTNPTTISGTWVQDFKLDVDSDNASFQAFAQELKATVDFALDLTAGNVYYYAKRTTDAGDSFEEIVAQADGKYFYKSSAQNPVELENEAAAVAKIEAAFKAITTEKSGWLDVDAFLYDSAWVGDYLMLGSTNVPTGEGRNFAYTYEQTDGGLKIGLDAKYVGYTGDSGIVDVGTNDTLTGSKVSIETNGQGHILSMNQTVNNYIEFNITNPPIPLLYTGTRTLTASYGSVTRKALEDVAMTATAGIATVVKDANVLKVELYDFKYDGMVFTATTGKVEQGNFVAVKVECGAGFEVDTVKVNGVDASNMNGYYCHMTPVAAGEAYEVVITTKQSGDGPVETTATVTVEAVEGITYELYDFKYDGMVFTPSEGKVEQGNFIALKITSEGEVSVKVDGNEAQFINGYYCYMTSVKAGQTYAVTITEAGAEENPVDPGTTKGTAAVEAGDIQYKLFDFDLATYNFVETTGEVEAGHYIALQIISEGGFQVTVNGEDTQIIAGYYCYMNPVVAGKSYAVVIAADGGETASESTVTLAAVEHATCQLFDFSLPANLVPATDKVAVGNFIAVQVTCEEGYQVASVTVNGEATMLQFGYYCYMVPAAGEYEVVVTVQPIAA